MVIYKFYRLSGLTKTVAIVENEKTAVMASMFFDDALFLATGGLTNLSSDKCEVLRGRDEGLDIGDFLQHLNPEKRLSVEDYL